MSYTWNLSELTLRSALSVFGIAGVDGYCDHLPIYQTPAADNRRCGCGRLTISFAEMVTCQSANAFVQLVREKIEICRVPDVLTMALKKSRTSTMELFFDALRSLHFKLDPRWKVVVVDRPDDLIVTIRLENSETDESHTKFLDYATLQDRDPQTVADHIVNWMVAVVGPPVQLPPTPVPVKQPYTCCHPGCGRRYEPADWCPAGHAADIWSDVMIRARARDVSSKNRSLKESLDSNDVEVEVLPGKTRLIELSGDE